MNGLDGWIIVGWKNELISSIDRLDGWLAGWRFRRKESKTNISNKDKSACINK